MICGLLWGRLGVKISLEVLGKNEKELFDFLFISEQGRVVLWSAHPRSFF